ncbi:hypothetical protein SB783_38000, partial [Paraburkholderia sp. SIMBA_009]
MTALLQGSRSPYMRAVAGNTFKVLKMNGFSILTHGIAGNHAEAPLNAAMPRIPEGSMMHANGSGAPDLNQMLMLRQQLGAQTTAEIR